MAKIKRKIVTDFTTVQNDFLRDRELGLTERGLLMTMLSLPDNWDYSAAGLASILPDGIKKTRASLQRLEGKGYLKRSRIYENGKVVDWLYEFCEIPVFLDEIKEKNLEAQNVLVGQNLEAQNVLVEKVQVGKVQVGNGENNKRTKKSNTKKLISLNNQSIHHSEELSENGDNSPKVKNDRLIDRELIEDIKDQIEYDIMKERYDSELLDTAVSCIANLYTVTEPQEFSGSTYAPEFVHRRSLEINASHIEYVFECFEQQRDKVFNIPKYLRAAIFNAPDTISAYYTNAVRADGAVW